MNILENLNNEQIEAVNSTGPTRIIACPGSGKTRTLTAKIANSIINHGVEPWKILVITFTNKAANEIQERLKKILRDENLVPKVYTYHSFAAYFLRLEAININLDSNYKIIDTQDQSVIMRKLLKNRELTTRDISLSELFDSFSSFNLASKEIKKISFLNNKEKKLMYDLYLEYKEVKKNISALDFNDLLIKTEELLKNNEDISNKWKNKFPEIYIDEFQDTNNIQYEIIKCITNSDSDLTVVGDPDQNIYSWRGANISIILNMDKDYEKITTVKLVRNYRSTPEIIDAANNLITHNKNRIPNVNVPVNESGLEIKYLTTSSKQNQAKFVFSKIEELLRNGDSLNDIAIIYRSNFLSIDFESIATSKGIPYKLIGGYRFYDRKEVKETLNYFSFFINRDNFSLTNIINIPSRKNGEKSISKWTNEAIWNNVSIYDYLCLEKDSVNTSTRNFIEIYNEIIPNVSSTNLFDKFLDFIKKVGFMDYCEKDNKFENVLEFIEQLKVKFDSSNPDYVMQSNEILQSISLLSSNDVENGSNHLTMMTVHGAKGTEFKNVFVVGVLETIIPSSRSISSKDIEEERRIMYVAITRAKQRLYIINYDGYDFNFNKLLPSRFIKEMGLINRTLNNYNLYDSTSYENKFKIDEDFEIEVDDIIEHVEFGEGIVIKVFDKTITVAFNNKYGVKTLLKGHSSYKKK